MCVGQQFQIDLLLTTKILIINFLAAKTAKNTTLIKSFHFQNMVWLPTTFIAHKNFYFYFYFTCIYCIPIYSIIFIFYLIFF
jgi:hypothetical protein